MLHYPGELFPLKITVFTLVCHCHPLRGHGPSGQLRALRPLNEPGFFIIAEYLFCIFSQSDSSYFTMSPGLMQTSSVGAGQRSQCLVITKRIVGSEDKNGWVKFVACSFSIRDSRNKLNKTTLLRISLDLTWAISMCS